VELRDILSNKQARGATGLPWDGAGRSAPSANTFTRLTHLGVGYLLPSTIVLFPVSLGT